MNTKEAFILWCQHSSPTSMLSLNTKCPFDIVAVSEYNFAKQLADNKQRNSFKLLYEVASPLGNAIADQVNLTQALAENPHSSDAILQKYKQITQSEIERSLELGVDGILYRLIGANPSHTTPMQYGGFYLETDRELLNAAKNLPCNLLYVEGQEESYLDFVHDLPAHILAWESKLWDIEKVKHIHKGPLAVDIEWMLEKQSQDQTVDFYLIKSNDSSNQKVQLMIRNIEHLGSVLVHE
jgi:hypothetical protein